MSAISKSQSCGDHKKTKQGGKQPTIKNTQKQNVSKVTETDKKRRSREPLDGSKVIRLLGSRSVYHVAVEDFIKVSQLIKQQHTAGNLMSTVDLHRFSDQSIMAFVNFVQSQEIKTALTYYAITELVTLAHTFQMKALKTCLEDSIIEAARSSEADLLQTMIICDVAHVNPETEKALQTLAIEQIEKLVTLPDFNKMPFHQLFQILSSCELPVSHEMFVADVVLLWLVGQSHVNAFAPSLLSCIRTKFLSPVDRTLIIERINQLNMSSKLARLARNMLESTNSQRTCLENTHLKKNLIRCGLNANPSHFNPHSSLPLSRPSFNMKMKQTKENNSKSKPVYDPSTAPKVIDLINTDPKGIKTETSVKKGTTVSNKSVKSEKTKKIHKKSKSRCACVEYLKSKMSGKSKKQGPQFKNKDPNAVKVRPPGVESKQTDTTKTSMSSNLSSSSKTNVNSNRSEKNIEKRRAQKRGKIQNAIKTSKSMSDTSLSIGKDGKKNDKKKGTRSKTN